MGTSKRGQLTQSSNKQGAKLNKRDPIMHRVNELSQVSCIVQIHKPGQLTYFAYLSRKKAGKE